MLRTPQIRFFGKTALALAVVVVVVVVAVAAAAEDCSPPAGACQEPIHCPLVQPPTVWADGGVLETDLTVKLREVCVPAVDFSSTSETADDMNAFFTKLDLRNYYSPATPGGATHGPTLRMRKTTLADPTEPPGDDNPIVENGSRVIIHLKNQLPPGGDPSACRVVTYAACSDNPTELCSCDAEDANCPTAEDFTCEAGTSRTCEILDIDQAAPNCFHGDNVTNLHYHGTHVSPQPPQDYVLLRVFPEGQELADPSILDDPAYALGEYTSNINPFPWNQAPGTHWYHPHKHGSTAVQLINGMSGAFLIQGPIDDYLYKLYGVANDQGVIDKQKLASFEKVLLVQQLWDDVLFFVKDKPTGYEPYPVVNGQLVPVIKMKYGEVQRWRLIGATTNGRVQVLMGFDFPTDFPGFEVKQIAQDGVQFAPENYDSQQLSENNDGMYELSPGNRVDLLVRAPDAPADGGTLTFHLTQRVVGKISEEIKKKVRVQSAYLKKTSGVVGKKAVDDPFTGPLIRVEVSGTVTPPTGLPTAWPEMPYYLQDISNEDTGTTRTVAFSMSTTDSGSDTVATPGASFFIDGRQYADDCAGQTVVRGDVETWKITNTSSPTHPFHIHTNPFQLLSKRIRSDSPTTVVSYDAPYPWMDTIALPAGTVSQPSVTKIRQHYEDYTGAYVLHCHFLGHEDRGMMANVQAVCDTDDAAKGAIMFGTTDMAGTSDDCEVAPDDYITPLPSCPGFASSGDD